MKRFTSQAGSFGNAMASLGSDSVKKATNLTGGMLGKQPSSSEATPKPPPPTQLSQRDINRPARILSLDGGGVRGYSTLIILKRFMLNLQANSPSKQKILPADYFDLIIGTSTGGIIALMLGRLRMSIDDAIIAYQELSKKIFSGGIASAVLGGNLLSSENPGLGLGLGIVKGRELDQYLNMAKTSAFASDTAMYDAARLETYLKETIGKQGYTISNQEALLEEDSNNCYTAIVTARQNNATAAYIMRSYQRKGQPTDDKIKIWEAARATSAAPAFFAPITIGQLKIKYIDGAVTGHCNPSELAREEVDAVWPGRKIGLLLSLGTGAPTEVSLAGSNSSKLVAFIALSANTIQVHERVMRYFNQVCGEQHSPYMRLSVEHTIDKIRLDDYEKLDEIAAATESYLDTELRKSYLDRALGLGDRKDTDMPPTSYSSTENSRSNSLLAQPIVDSTLTELETGA